MGRPADLASQPDWAAGPLRVSPARRTVSGPAGTASVEPIVMQLLVQLIEAEGRVVTRDELFEACWGDGIAGDDSLNRAVGQARKALSQCAPGAVEIETITRTGYRLVGEPFEALQTEAPLDADREGARLSRRSLIASAGGIAALGTAGGGLFWVRSSEQRRFDEMMASGVARLDYGDSSLEAARFFRQAAALRPDDAAVQGLLAFAETVPGGSAQSAAAAARRALTINPREPNARLAEIELHHSVLDMPATEDRLRAILADDPANIYAMRLLWSLLQCAGRSRDGLALVQRAIVVKPLAASNIYPLAQFLWITGRTPEADRVADQAMRLWPDHRVVRFARFTIFAFTNRPRAALKMLASPATAPQNFPPALIELWRRCLELLDDPAPARIARERPAILAAVGTDPQLASAAAMTLSTLGDLDGAFEAANDQFAYRSAASGRGPGASTAWRFAPWLFTPPIAAMRSDPRFDVLADAIGLTAYWRKRGISPDPPLG